MKYTKKSYRAKIHSLIAKKFKAKMYGGWTLKKANKIFDKDYWEEYRKTGDTPEEALDGDSYYWGDK